MSITVTMPIEEYQSLVKRAAPQGDFGSLRGKAFASLVTKLSAAKLKLGVHDAEQVVLAVEETLKEIL